MQDNTQEITVDTAAVSLAVAVCARAADQLADEGAVREARIMLQAIALLYTRWEMRATT